MNNWGFNLEKNTAYQAVNSWASLSHCFIVLYFIVCIDNGFIFLLSLFNLFFLLSVHFLIAHICLCLGCLYSLRHPSSFGPPCQLVTADCYWIMWKQLNIRENKVKKKRRQIAATCLMASNYRWVILENSLGNQKKHSYSVMKNKILKENHLLRWRIWPCGLTREQTQLSITLPLWIWWQYVFYLYNIEAALWANGNKSGDGCWETCVTEYFWWLCQWRGLTRTTEVPLV